METETFDRLEGPTGHLVEAIVDEADRILMEASTLPGWNKDWVVTDEVRLFFRGEVRERARNILLDLLDENFSCIIHMAAGQLRDRIVVGTAPKETQ